MNRFHGLMLSAVLLACVSACERPEPEPTRSPPSPQGREETRGIRNTEAIGYSGDAIADKLDAALDANDARNRELDRAIEQ